LTCLGGCGRGAVVPVEEGVVRREGAGLVISNPVFQVQKASTVTTRVEP
jgi:hypothetical protein